MSYDRKCRHIDCDAEVPHNQRQSGYCSKKRGAHWNEGEQNAWRPKCECGADTTKGPNNPHPAHSHWCPVAEWEK